MQLEEWQTGAECKINYLARIDLMNNWLKTNKKEITSGNTINEEKVIIGFVDL